MKRYFSDILALGILCAVALATPQARGEEKILSNPNLAYIARVEADSVYDQSYGAQGAIDGRVAKPKSGDVAVAWAVRGDKTGDAAEFFMEWETPQKI